MAPKQMVSKGHGKNVPRGIKRVTRSPLNEGRFGRLFRRLPPAPDLSDKELKDLAETMRESNKEAPKRDNPKIPAGYTYLTVRDFRMNPEHPPLVKELAALPLLLMDVHTVGASPAWALGQQWEFGHEFLYRWNDADRLLFWGRLPVVALGCALGAAVLLWTRRRFGLRAGAIAFFLYMVGAPGVGQTSYASRIRFKRRFAGAH